MNVENPPNRDLIRPSILYRGGRADRGLIRASELGESIVGASNLYSAVAFYMVTGRVPYGSQLKLFTVYTRATKPSSVEQLFVISPDEIVDMVLIAGLYGPEAGRVFSMLTGELLKIIMGFGSAARVTERMADIAAKSLENEGKALDNQSALIGAFERLAMSQRANAERLVAPVGNSCDEVVQFPRSADQLVVGVDRAKSIRDKKSRRRRMATYHVSIVKMVNVATGHCIVLHAGRSIYCESVERRVVDARQPAHGGIALEGTLHDQSRGQDQQG